MASYPHGSNFDGGSIRRGDRSHSRSRGYGDRGQGGRNGRVGRGERSGQGGSGGRGQRPRDGQGPPSGGGPTAGGHPRGRFVPQQLPTEALDHRVGFANHLEELVKHRNAKIRGGEKYGVHVLREEFVKEMAEKSVLTNHFSVELPRKDIYHHFEITGMVQSAKEPASPDLIDNEPSPDEAPVLKSLPRGQKEFLFQKLVGECNVLEESKAAYATDSMTHIVSWEDLRPLFGDEYVTATRNTVVFEKTITLREPSQSGSINWPGDFKDLKVIYRGLIPVTDMVNASQGTVPHFFVETSDSSSLSPEHALNLIIAKATKASSSRIVRVGRNKIYLEDTLKDLDNGVVAYKGFFSTIKVGMGKPLLNVSLATSAFYKPLDVNDFLDITGGNRKILTNRKARICYSDRIKTIKMFGRLPPRDQTFPFQDEQNPNQTSITVLEYMKTKGLDEDLLERIAVSEYPCVNSGTDKAPEWFPTEVLRLVTFQPVGKLSGTATDAMIDFARENPFPSLQRVIESGLATLGRRHQDKVDSTLHKAEIKISEGVMKVPAREVASPVVRYRDKHTFSEINTDLRRWNLQNKLFFNTNNVFDQQFVVLYPHSLWNGQTKATTYADKLVSEMRNTGIQMPHGLPYAVESVNLPDRGYCGEVLESKFTDMVTRRPGLQFILFINFDKSSRNAPIFDQVKRVAEQKHGIFAVCITDANAGKCNEKGGLAQYMCNVAMKINLKLGNINHGVFPDQGNGFGMLHDKDGQVDTIILGADVTHTQKDSNEEARSLAALVGSLDGTLGRYGGSMTYQEKNKEIIEGMYTMASQRLDAFRSKSGTGKLPKKILYYRDGVDPGQYSKVREHEVEALRKAYGDLATGTPDASIDPAITVVVVTKRHHTRFYPENVADYRNSNRYDSRMNCNPGTCVDSGVTHPNYFDFFLQSHKPLAGTARPTYYIVLENGMNLQPKMLQDFTNWLCYSYVRATVPVGYAPPAYYADRLCERARCYFSEFFKPLEEEKALLPKGQEMDADTEKQKKSDLWQGRYNDNDGNDHGPWNRRLNDTMFWM